MGQERQQRFAIAYDLSSDRERRRVERYLKGWGHRIQKSVFMVTASRTGIERCRNEIDGFGILTGSVIFLRLQSQTEHYAAGKPFVDPDREVAYII